MDEPGVMHTCKSCGNRFSGQYCNLCGEKVLVERDRSFRAFLNNILIAITFADNRFVKTLWLVLSRPGFLSAEFVEGRRVKYIRPLQLFFILNLLYFLFPVLQLFNSSLRTQMYHLAHSSWVRTWVVKRVVEEGLSLEGYELMYNAKSTSLAKLLVVVYVILAAVPLTLIFLKKRDRYFTDHITLSVELACFNLFVNALFLSALLWLANRLFSVFRPEWSIYLNENVLTVIFVCTNLYFVYRSAQTFYGLKGWRLPVFSVLVIVCLFLALEIYRLLLFFITYALV